MRRWTTAHRSSVRPRPFGQPAPLSPDPAGERGASEAHGEPVAMNRHQAGELELVGLTGHRSSGTIGAMLHIVLPLRVSMRHCSALIIQSLLGVVLLSACVSSRSAPESSVPRWVYPSTRQTDAVDDYHGVKVADPYRWLEDDNAPETKAWVDAQNAVTFGYLRRIPEREAIRARLTKLWNYERYGVPFKQGGRYFFTKNDGLQNQGVLYTLTSLEATPAVLLDPNTLSADGTVALTGYAVSDDGNLLAYGLATAGSDWQEWKVREVRTGRDLSDHIKWVKFSRASW